MLIFILATNSSSDDDYSALLPKPCDKYYQLEPEFVDDIVSQIEDEYNERCCAWIWISISLYVTLQVLQVKVEEKPSEYKSKLCFYYFKKIMKIVLVLSINSIKYSTLSTLKEIFF